MNARAYHLKRKYGITEKQYNELLLRQNGCCAVCEKDHRTFTRRLAVDHNHRTGEIRGLLCNYCNRRVIGRHTEAALLERAGRYLRQGTGWFVPEKKRKKRGRKNTVVRHRNRAKRRVRLGKV